MNFAKYLAQNIMPYGAPSMRRNAWKQELKAFVITFGVSALIAGASVFFDSIGDMEGENSGKKAVKDVLTMIKLELPKKGSGGGGEAPGPEKATLPPAAPQKSDLGIPTPISEVTIDMPKDPFDDKNIDRLVTKLNETFKIVDSTGKELSASAGKGNVPGNGNGGEVTLGPGNGGKGDGGDVFGEKFGEHTFVNYSKEVGFDMDALMNAISYPRTARSAGIEGEVMVRVLVGKDGSVKEASVISGQSIFHSSAIEAVSSVQYEAAEYEGEPAPCYLVIPIKYRLN